MATPEVCHRQGISSATSYKWKSKFGRLEVSEARRLRSPEEGNSRLKKLLGIYRKEGLRSVARNERQARADRWCCPMARTSAGASTLPLTA